MGVVGLEVDLFMMSLGIEYMWLVDEDLFFLIVRIEGVFLILMLFLDWLDGNWVNMLCDVIIFEVVFMDLYKIYLIVCMFDR